MRRLESSHSEQELKALAMQRKEVKDIVQKWSKDMDMFWGRDEARILKHIKEIYEKIYSENRFDNSSAFDSYVKYEFNTRLDQLIKQLEEKKV